MDHGEPATTVSQPQRTGVGSVFVSNYPPYSFWGMEQVPQARRALASPPRPDVPLGLYVHVPFCRKRCKFCYFKVYTEKNHADVQRYVDALAGEWENHARQPALAGRPLGFVYFGGGTPSFLGVRQLRSLVSRLQASAPWSGVAEVTFECEPGTLTLPKLEAIRELGVSRLSLGVESFDDRVLEENGRAHVSKEIRRAFQWLRQVEFPQLNVDLIAGMVGETWETWNDTVERTLDAAPDSVTIYQLELPYNTVFSRHVLDGTAAVPLADWETKRAWHEHALERFAAAGYAVSSAYTVVRGAVPPRFVYRDSLWHGADMIGIGVASFSHLSGVHFQNESSWEPYLGRVEAGELPIARAFVTTERERLTREVILQLKLGALDPEYFRAKFGVDVRRTFADALERLRQRKMVDLEGGTIRLTRSGLLQVDMLLPEFYAEEHRNARYT
jgi:oxygen-independent coproporphyrinogen-3 oxidase